MWTTIGLAALGLIISPLFDDTSCHVEAWEDHPTYKEWVSPRGLLTGDDADFPWIIYNFNYVYVAAVALAVLLDPQGRFDSKVVLHFWARRYAISIILLAANLSVRPWLFAVCPSGSLDVSTWFVLGLPIVR